MKLLGFLLILSCLPSALLDFAIPKWKADKNVHIEDAYKWLYQATRGGEHAVQDEESARKWLDGEWQTLGNPLTKEPEWEPLCPGAEIGRLNLRPYKKAGSGENDLLQAFLASSREYRTDGSAFLEAWTELGKRVKKHRIGALSYKAWSGLDRTMKPQNYPAVHHSTVYETARHPAYRVLTRNQMELLLEHRQ